MPNCPKTGEAKARIETMTGIGRSPTQVRAFMRRNGLNYLKAGHVPAKAGYGSLQKKILYAKYYDTPTKFHSAITGFFSDVSLKYKEDLENY